MRNTEKTNTCHYRAGHDNLLTRSTGQARRGQLSQDLRGQRNSTKSAFTLVELIIVITILAILRTIGFMSFQTYTADARDSNRMTTLRTIGNGLDMYQLKNIYLPTPDEKLLTTLDASGNTISYQGYVGATIQKTIKMTSDTIDPKDKNYYTYSTNGNKTKYQLLALLENNPTIAYSENINKNTKLINQTYARIDYTTRYPYSVGQKVGIFFTGTTNQPYQEALSTQTYTLALSGITTQMKVMFSNALVTNSGTIIATGSSLPAIVVTETQSVAISGGSGGGSTTVNATCGTANGTTVSIKPTAGLCGDLTTPTVSGTGPWTWTCLGTGTPVGTNASCSANKTLVVGDTGTVTYTSGTTYTYTTKVMPMKRSDNSTYNAIWTTQNMRHPVNLSGTSCSGKTWVNSSDVGWCGIYSGDANNGATYGWLYQHSAAKEVCKLLGTGWNLATNEQFNELERGLGCTDPSPTGIWNRCGNGYGGFTRGTYGLGYTASSTESVRYMGGVFGTNSTALPGYRDTVGAFGSRSTSGGWWSSTGDSANASGRSLVSSSSAVRLSSVSVANGFSVVCIKN